ncbi:unnamed protein product [Protopolystoma xenopodis]|uniref:Uncharacterized protein n=1 Tax=Protopolystoma xenopodis TaxID=117903 RepID=A0A3S5A5Y3_9PLAT|nr:unnamed protein product [Protopolystoma xenopodis]VEL32352.1 unnamed protein product [Protopolystoma xenopodis]
MNRRLAVYNDQLADFDQYLQEFSASLYARFNGTMIVSANSFLIRRKFPPQSRWSLVRELRSKDTDYQ